MPAPLFPESLQGSPYIGDQRGPAHPSLGEGRSRRRERPRWSSTPCLGSALSSRQMQFRREELFNLGRKPTLSRLYSGSPGSLLPAVLPLREARPQPRAYAGCPR